VRETFTVRKISFGVGVERTFPLHSPSIAKIEVVSRGQVRRAKLYYLRQLRGKKARIRERRIDDAKLAAMEATPVPDEPDDAVEPDDALEPDVAADETEGSVEAEDAPDEASAEPDDGAPADGETPESDEAASADEEKAEA
jgi:hypothetical protein